MNNPILITGGLGYVGGRIARALIERGESLVLMGRRDPALAPAWTRPARMVQADLADPDFDLSGVCAGIDTVLHLAALNEIDCARDPVAALDVNGIGSLRLLRASEQAGCRRFVYFSTAHVYGAPLAGRLDETTLARPQHPYAITHRVAEDFVLAAHDRKALQGLVLRLSNGIGAPADAGADRWTLLGNDLCRQAVRDRRMVLRSSGLQPRDFIGLSEVARAIGHFLDTPDWGDGLFNLGLGRSALVLDMVSLIAERCQEVLGFTPAIDKPAPMPGEVAPVLDYRVDKLAATGFTPRDVLTQEIDATLCFCAKAFS